MIGGVSARGQRHLRSGDRRRLVAEARRHGLPEVESVSEVDLRERRLRPAHRRRSGEEILAELVETSSLRQAGLWDEVKDRLRRFGARALRRPAAAALHRPRAGHRSRRAADGRTGSALDPASTARIEDLIVRAETQLHDRHRHAQHAAGRPRQRPDGLLLPGTSDRGRVDRAEFSRIRCKKRPKNYHDRGWFGLQGLSAIVKVLRRRFRIMSIHLDRRDSTSMHRKVMTMCGHVEEMIHQAVDALHPAAVSQGPRNRREGRRHRPHGRADRRGMPQAARTASAGRHRPAAHHDGDEDQRPNWNGSPTSG